MELIVISFFAVFLWFFAHVGMVVAQRLFHGKGTSKRSPNVPHLPSPPTPPARGLESSSCAAETEEPALA
jgi:hypothetical protein